MCILFLYLGDKDGAQQGSFKVILAVNRDEMYRRPTSPATFWDNDPDILGGIDMEPNRQGGTWLAMSKTGKIAALLNVLQSQKDFDNASQRKGRGFLVNNFLKSSDDGLEYMKKLCQTSTDYNPFCLLTLDKLGEDAPQACYFSYHLTGTTKPKVLEAGKVHGVGNSYIDNPFQKVISGREAIQKVITECNDKSKTAELINGILGVLKNEEKYHPDPEMYKMAADKPEAFLHGISSRFIKLPGYGTRTHTIILVDYDNNVHYVESTLEEPINENQPSWSTKSFDFTLESRQSTEL